MRPTRRQLLVGLPASLIACKGADPLKESFSTETPERAPEPPEWEPEGTQDEVIFAWGVQSGDVTTNSVVLSFRSTEVVFELVVVEAQGQSWVELERRSLERTDETIQLALGGLKPDTAYRYAVFTGTSRSRVGRFRTAPEAKALRKLSIGITSCLGGNEPWPNLSFAAQEQLDLFLLLGDTVYADDAVVLEDYREYYRHAFSVEGLKAVTASTSIVATWDDHEVGNNWSRDELAEGQFEAALQAYRESLPQTQGEAGQIWRKLVYGDMLELFVLDCRSERTESLYLSVEQMEWLKAGLLESKARFKLILNSVPINDYTDMFGEVYAEDRWQGFSIQRWEILDFIIEKELEGVLWVAGDVHHGMICHPDAPGGGSGEKQWELACGPSGSTLNVAAELYTDTTGHYPVLFAEWNYTKLTLDPGTGSCLVQFVGDDGAIIQELELML
jgi:alkaline phosphatase D